MICAIPGTSVCLAAAVALLVLMSACVSDHPTSLSASDSVKITPEHLNAKAAMFVRLDNEYIVPADRFQPALIAFADHFDVLQIGLQRAFTYVFHPG